MRAIRKHLVTDENMRPVAVQIEYSDWLALESILKSDLPQGKTSDLSRHVGVIALLEDPLEFQERMRSEWP